MVLSASVATVAAMSNHDLGGLGLLFIGVGGLRELDACAGIGEGGRHGRVFENLNLEFVPFAEAVEELQHEIDVGDRPANGCQVIRDRLEFACVGDDGLITAGAVPERLAEEDVARSLIVEEEALQAVPGGAGAAVAAADESEQVIGKSGHEPQGDVDVHR
jgi:hypothetical protein